jgi:hypothetical protein
LGNQPQIKCALKVPVFALPTASRFWRPYRARRNKTTQPGFTLGNNPKLKCALKVALEGCAAVERFFVCPVRSDFWPPIQGLTPPAPGAEDISQERLIFHESSETLSSTSKPLSYSELARQAAIKPLNSGCGAFGFDKNSG